MEIKYQLWGFWGWGRLQTLTLKLNADGCLGKKAKRKWLALEKELAGKKHRRWVNDAETTNNS